MKEKILDFINSTKETLLGLSTGTQVAIGIAGVVAVTGVVAGAVVISNANNKADDDYIFAKDSDTDIIEDIDLENEDLDIDLDEDLDIEDDDIDNDNDLENDTINTTDDVADNSSNNSSNSSNNSSSNNSSSSSTVTTKTETKTETIAYDTIRQNDATLDKGTEVVKTNGSNGTRTITYTVTYTNGTETNRTIKSNVVTKQPVDKVILVGTKEVVDKTSGRDYELESYLKSTSYFSVSSTKYHSMGGVKVSTFDSYLSQLHSGSISESGLRSTLLGMEWKEPNYHYPDSTMYCEIYDVSVVKFTTSETDYAKILNEISSKNLSGGEYKNVMCSWDNTTKKYTISVLRLSIST